MQQLLESTPTLTEARCPADQQTAASMLGLLRSGADMRQRKIRRVRAAVRIKSYENPLKLAIAIDRLINVLED